MHYEKTLQLAVSGAEKDMLRKKLTEVCPDISA
jgi:hypothetical protein